MRKSIFKAVDRCEILIRSTEHSGISSGLGIYGYTEDKIEEGIIKLNSARRLLNSRALSNNANQIFVLRERINEYFLRDRKLFQISFASQPLLEDIIPPYIKQYSYKRWRNTIKKFYNDISSIPAAIKAIENFCYTPKVITSRLNLITELDKAIESVSELADVNEYINNYAVLYDLIDYCSELEIVAKEVFKRKSYLLKTMGIVN
ncbi:MAG: hypothetical protein N4A72_05360 [Bacteroidales bacterium]|jgi:hypothetical protein|nr:hypothetical protein [Bacteroidales bacterium]